MGLSGLRIKTHDGFAVAVEKHFPFLLSIKFRVPEPQQTQLMTVSLTELIVRAELPVSLAFGMSC